MLAYAVAWFSAAVVYLGLDAIWLGQMTPLLYRPLIGEIMAPKLNVAAAIAFYVIYVSGLIFLAVAPALEKASLGKALVLGATLGLVAYGAYDLTNQASLRVWDIRITLADMSWGAFASAMAASAAYLVASRLA